MISPQLMSAFDPCGASAGEVLDPDGYFVNLNVAILQPTIHAGEMLVADPREGLRAFKARPAGRPWRIRGQMGRSPRQLDRGRT